MTTHLEDANPCSALACDMQADPIETCRKRGCGFRWQRESIEDRKAREEKDAARRTAI